MTVDRRPRAPAALGLVGAAEVCGLLGAPVLLIVAVVLALSPLVRGLVLGRW